MRTKFKNLFRKIVKKIVYFGIQPELEQKQQKIVDLEREIFEIKKENREIQSKVKQELENLKHQNEEYANSIQYFGDLMAEKSYLIDCTRKTLDKQEISIEKIAIKLNALTTENVSLEKRVIQIVPVLKYGDAIGNYALNAKKIFEDSGYKSEIYAYEIDKRITDESIHLIEDLPILGTNDILMLHMAADSHFAHLFDAYQCKKILIYHNITPPAFFEGVNEFAEVSTANGLQIVKELAGKIDGCIVDSEFNKNDLKSMGYKCPIEVVAIPISFTDYDRNPDEELIKKLKNGKGHKIIFVGRIAPNKKLEDVIHCFSTYQKNYEAEAELYLVGNYEEQDLYFQKLRQIILLEEVKNVTFTGHVTFAEILSYYHTADLFLCMSEHEGFCVPLMEAMYFEVPIIAYRATAIPETLQNGGILCDSKEPQFIAAKMKHILNDVQQQQEMKERQRKIVNIYKEKMESGKLVECIQKMLEEKKDEY